MNEKIASLKKTFNEHLELLKAQKIDEAIAKLADVATDLEALATEDEETVTKVTKTEETVTKTADLLKSAEELIKTQAEELKKWAELHVVADDYKQLVADVKSGGETVSALTKKVEELEKTSISRQASGASVATSALSSIKIA